MSKELIDQKSVVTPSMDAENNSTSAQPLVTVIIPSYNHERYIEQAILSVITQTYKEIQLIVIDDGSKDESLKIVNRLADLHGFEVVARENRGLANTLNEGIGLARGKYIGILGSDDYYLPKRIENAVLQLELSSDNVVAVYCDGYIVNAEGKKVGLFGEKYQRPLVGDVYDNLLIANWIPALGMTYKAEALKQFMFDERFRVEDYTLYLRMFKSKKHRLKFYDDFGFAYRWHGNNFSSLSETMDREAALIQKNFADVARYVEFKHRLKTLSLMNTEIFRWSNYFLTLLFSIRKLQNQSKTYHRNIYGLFRYFFSRAIRLMNERAKGFLYFGFEGFFRKVRVSGRISFRGRKSNFKFGKNCRILGDLHLVLSDSWKVKPSIVLGDNVIIDHGVYMNFHGGAITAGNNCHFGVGAVIQAGGELTIGDDVLFGPGTKIFASNHSISNKRYEAERLSEAGECFKGIRIGNNVWVGADCVILDGSTLADWTVYGAGGIVSGNYQANTVNVAKKVRITDVIHNQDLL